MNIFSIVSTLIYVFTLTVAAYFIYAGDSVKAAIFIIFFLINDIFVVINELLKRTDKLRK